MFSNKYNHIGYLPMFVFGFNGHNITEQIYFNIGLIENAMHAIVVIIILNLLVKEKV